MRWCIAALLLSGCGLFDWSWYDEIALEPMVLDDELPEAWVGWETTLHVFEDFSEELTEWDEEQWEEDDAGVGLEVAVGLRARVLPEGGPATIRVLNWGFAPDDLVAGPEVFEVPAEGATLEIESDWQFCEVGWSCSWFDERRFDLRSSEPATLELTLVVEGRTPRNTNSDRIADDSFVELDRFWGWNP